MIPDSEEQGLSAERFYEIAADARPGDIDAALARFSAAARLRSPIAIGLRSMRSVTGGDLPGGIALLKRGVAHARGPIRLYLLELLVPLLLTTNQLADAEEALEAADDSIPDLVAAFAASRSLLAAQRGNDEASIRYAEEALAAGRAVDNASIVGRVLLRTAIAAFYREDFEEAQDRALEATRWNERHGAHRLAALCYSLLYVIAQDWVGDPDVARYHARRLTANAHQAGDVALENYGLIAQLDIATQSGDERRAGSLRIRLAADPLNEQYFRERFIYTISEALASGWEGRFERARTALSAVRFKDELSLPERALCDALLAIVALASQDVDLAKRLARRTISETSHFGVKEPLFQARFRKIARILAAAVSIVLGDTVRGRRALPRSVDPEQRFVQIIGPSGIDLEAAPAAMRGFALFLNRGCEAAQVAERRHALTTAELEVLRELPAGTTLATIAMSLGKSKKTVERQVGNIYAKLHVGNRAQAIARARELGIALK